MTNTERFLKLRQKIFDDIREALEEDSHHKSYEGALTIHQHYDNYFESIGEDYPSAPKYGITLDCYVLGPSRHYEFYGDNLEQCLNQLEGFIESSYSAEYYDVIVR